jgi:hypothetical protein
MPRGCCENVSICHGVRLPWMGAPVLDVKGTGRVARWAPEGAVAAHGGEDAQRPGVRALMHTLSGAPVGVITGALV